MSAWVVRDGERKAGRRRIRNKVEDSGHGFKRKEEATSPDESDTPSGRGISLVQQLCTSLDYNERGNEVEAVLSW